MEEDVRMIKRMGLKAYRFSISWSRVLPLGKGKINEQVLGSMDEQPAERLRILHPLSGPTAIPSGSQELIPGQPDIAGARAGEEIQILRRTRRKPLRQ